MRFAPSAVSQARSQAFYIWFNVFNLFVTMVFWALLADRFSSDQGKRFFALISVGGTLGTIIGPWLTSQLANSLGTSSLLMVASGFLLLGMLTAWLLLRIAPDRETEQGAASRAKEAERIGGSAWAGVRSVIRSPYLSGIASYVMLTTLMVTLVYFTRLQMVVQDLTLGMEQTFGKPAPKTSAGNHVRYSSRPSQRTKRHLRREVGTMRHADDGQ